MDEFFLSHLYSRYAESVGAVHFHTSAKANKGVDEVFMALAQSNLSPSSHFCTHLNCNFMSLFAIRNVGAKE